MKIKSIALSLIAAALGALVWLAVTKPPPTGPVEAPVNSAKAELTPAMPVPVDVTLSEEMEAANIVVPVTNLVATAKPSKKSRHKAKAKAEIQDPAARAALSLVGADPVAEAYWTSAINDPSLPAEERKDLIEDLNEDGLADPHHLAPDDVPLIANRLELIEEQAPYAMDNVNAQAFQEAEKDLVNLLNGQTVP